MPQQITITDNDIGFTEGILLSSEDHFDSERINFIKNLTTIDLQACPGSGKTTCLLAKLLILSKYLPLEQNQGLLVLSHSNAAVDEIKYKLINHCPKLFEYPNFVGTIQSFVDQFLAIPYFQQEYGSLPYRIDDEIFNERVWIPRGAQGWLNNKPNKEEIVKNLRFDTNDKIISITKLPGENTATYKSLYQMRKKLLEEGYLCYDDAFYLGERYIKTFPHIVDLIQKRFKYVFIDEMQDTDTSQINILNKLFPINGQTIIQKIGDQNQAIYSWKVKAENAWIPQSNHLKLNGSKRLSVSIATAIKNISLTPQELNGNTSRQEIKPKCILYDDNTIKEVPQKFGELIIENNLHENNQAIFKAIGWRKQSADPCKLCIGSYFDNYQELKNKNKTDFDSLDQYLNINLSLIEQQSLSVPRKNILNAIIKILRILKIKNNEIYFTITSFLKFLKEEHTDKYEKLKLKSYKWSISIYKKQQIFNEVKEYVLDLVNQIFSIDENQAITTLNNFLSTQDSQTTNETEVVEIPINIFKYEDQGIAVNIEIGTIHSVKGETHTATLYLETFYQRYYESQRLIEQLKGNRVNRCAIRIKESLKMAYVGMSRPTDLLCVAFHKTRIPSNEIPFLQNNWEIVDLTLN